MSPLKRGILLLCVLVSMAVWGGMHAVATGIEPQVEGNLHWYNARDWGVSGKGWDDTLAYYDRLPSKAAAVVPSAVWNLSRQSAGMYVEFETNSPLIRARWTLTSSRLALPHMPATGVSGVDLYVANDNDEWQWLATGKPETYPRLNVQLISGLGKETRRYRLYLPLYNGVHSVEVGVSAGAEFHPVAPSPAKPIVFYGTSITQGAAASRPGMAYTAILGRWLNVPVINLGFSGSGKMEPELAELLAELDAAVFVLDAFPNMDAGLINLNFERFVKIIRAAHPETPIVVVEDREFANTPHLQARQTHYALTRINAQAGFNRLQNAGIGNLHFIPRDGLFGDDNEGTVDASHPTDLGFMRYAEVVAPVLKGLLGND